MKTRFLSLVLTVAVLCSCMAVTVGASEIDVEQTQLINVLDFSTPNDSGNMWVKNDTSGFASATFSLPYSTLIRYVDIVISSQKGLEAATLVVGNSRTALTLEAVSGSTYYRLYGVFGGAWADSFTIEFDVPSAVAGYIQFYSVHMSAQPSQVLASPSTFILEDQSVTQTNGNTLVSLSYTYTTSANGMNAPWTSSVRNSNWSKYDYMTFTLSYYTHSINNVNVQIGGKPIPYTMNMVENPPDFNGYTDPDYGLGNAVNIYSISITVDLSGLQRTITDDLIVTVQGMGISCNASLHNSYGYVPADLPEAEITWLQKIWKALIGDSSQADEFQDDVDNKTSELETMAGIMDSVETPDEFRPDLNTETDDIQSFVGEGGLGYVITSPYILPLFVVSMTFCFVSYALYGKKG